MTHIILLDGKLWKVDLPEKFKDWQDYGRAYSLALVKKIEVENMYDLESILFDPETHEWWLMTSPQPTEIKENEPIKWEGPMTKILQVRHGVEWHDLPGKAGQERDGIYRTVVRLIAPVKEGLIEKLNKVSDKLDAEDKGRRNLTSDQLAVNADAQHPKPVPSEQEKQEPRILEVIGNFLHSSGLVFDTNDADHVASDFIKYLKSEGLTITRK